MAKYGEPGSMSLGPYFCENPHHALLHHCLDPWIGRYPRDIRNSGSGAVIGQETGVALEFGVGEGHSLRCIAEWMPVIGFDSFNGLPEDWRPGFEEGAFACDPPLHLPHNAAIRRGLFEEVLPTYPWEGMRDIRLVHIDCDLYSSTKTVLENLPWSAMLRPFHLPKPVIIFDEFWGFPDAERHEARAWREFTEEHRDLEWEVIGHGVQQWAIRLV